VAEAASDSGTMFTHFEVFRSIKPVVASFGRIVEVNSCLLEMTLLVCLFLKCRHVGIHGYFTYP